VKKLYLSVRQFMTIAALLLTPVLACAQTAATSATSASPPSKSSVKVDMVPTLFVMNARGASLQGQTLTLAGVSPTSIVFADRPVRAAGHLPTEALLEEWTTGDFAKDAPNATVSVLSKDGLSAHDVVVELKTPHHEGDRLTFAMCACWRVTWEAPTAQLRYLSTLSACRSRHCRLPAWPGARRGELIGMGPLPRHTTDPMDTQATTPPILIRTDVAAVRS
jgi:hypothetical protein